MAKRNGVWIAAISLSCTLSAAFAACGGGGEGGGPGAGGATTTTGGAAHGGGGGGLFSDAGVESLSIEPKTAMLVVDQTTPKTQTFTAKAVFDDGTTGVVPATFSVAEPEPGSIDSKTGVYTTSNAAGGLVHVTA